MPTNAQLNTKNRIKELRKIIEYHNNKYYTSDKPEISDYEYDKLYLELKKLEEEYPIFKTKSSPTQKVGSSIKRELKQEKHDIPVLSLQNIFTKEEVYTFVNKIIKEFDNPIFIVETKIDGLSIILRYEYGKLTEGLTRGNGILGESVYENLLVIPSIPNNIPNDFPYLEVRGEIYISKKVFEQINAIQKKTGEKLYQTPRNLASGSIRQLNPNIVKERNLDMFVFNLEVLHEKNFTSHADTLNWLYSQGFPINLDFFICNTADKVWNAITKIKENEDNIPFEIDGAVIKVDNLKYREQLGSTSKFPKWAVAYKYPPEQKETILEDIKVQIGRTGRLTPLAILKPIKLDGITITKATLHNQDFIDTKDIQIGDTVIIQRAGDVIPEVLCNIPEKRTVNSKKYTIPDKCPACGCQTLKYNHQVDIRCTNLNCSERNIRQLIFFASKDAMNIDGFGPKIIESLIKEGYINNIEDIYLLKNYRDELIIKNIIGKEKTIDNLIKAIEKSKNNDISNLITGLGINNIGKQTAKILTSKFPDMQSISNASYEELIELPNLGEIIVKEIIDYFSNPKIQLLLSKLQELGVNMKSINTLTKNELSGKTFVLTGTLPTMTREETTELIEKYGGKISNSVSKKTSYVIAGENAGNKLVKAQSLNIQIINEEDFKKLIL